MKINYMAVGRRMKSILFILSTFFIGRYCKEHHGISGERKEGTSCPDKDGWGEDTGVKNVPGHAYYCTDGLIQTSCNTANCHFPYFYIDYTHTQRIFSVQIWIKKGDAKGRYLLTNQFLGFGFAVTDTLPKKKRGLHKDLIDIEFAPYEDDDQYVYSWQRLESDQQMQGKMGRYVIVQLKGVGNLEVAEVVVDLHKGCFKEDNKYPNSEVLENVTTLRGETECASKCVTNAACNFWTLDKLNMKCDLQVYDGKRVIGYNYKYNRVISGSRACGKEPKYVNIDLAGGPFWKGNFKLLFVTRDFQDHVFGAYEKQPTRMNEYAVWKKMQGDYYLYVWRKAEFEYDKWSWVIGKKPILIRKHVLDHPRALLVNRTQTPGSPVGLFGWITIGNVQMIDSQPANLEIFGQTNIIVKPLLDCDGFLCDGNSSCIRNVCLEVCPTGNNLLLRCDCAGVDCGSGKQCTDRKCTKKGPIKKLINDRNDTAVLIPSPVLQQLNQNSQPHIQMKDLVQSQESNKKLDNQYEEIVSDAVQTAIQDLVQSQESNKKLDKKFEEIVSDAVQTAVQGLIRSQESNKTIDKIFEDTVEDAVQTAKQSSIQSQESIKKIDKIFEDTLEDAVQTAKQSDCQNKEGYGKDYVGTVSKTKSGLTCQNWTNQSPNRHGYDHLGNHNFCRNPDGNTGVWCYTTSSAKRWELCDVPVCDHADNGQDDKSHTDIDHSKKEHTNKAQADKEHTNNAHADKGHIDSDNGDKVHNSDKDHGNNDHADNGHTDNDHTGKDHTNNDYADKDHNENDHAEKGYNVNNNMDKENKENEHVDKDDKVDKEYSVSCQVGKGKKYRGTMSQTKSGITCQKWSKQSPWKHNEYTAIKRKQFGIGDHNYCRNPNGRGGVWCLTTTTETKREYCDVPVCGDENVKKNQARPTETPNQLRRSNIKPKIGAGQLPVDSRQKSSKTIQKEKEIDSKNSKNRNASDLNCQNVKNASKLISKMNKLYIQYSDVKTKIISIHRTIDDIEKKQTRALQFDDAADYLKTVTKDGVECSKNASLNTEIIITLNSLLDCPANIESNCDSSKIKMDVMAKGLEYGGKCHNEYDAWIGPENKLPFTGYKNCCETEQSCPCYEILRFSPPISKSPPCNDSVITATQIDDEAQKVLRQCIVETYDPCLKMLLKAEELMAKCAEIGSKPCPDCTKTGACVLTAKEVNEQYCEPEHKVSNLSKRTFKENWHLHQLKESVEYLLKKGLN